MKHNLELNKLKKKLHLKKLIDFLNLYKYVVFYQSHKINMKNSFSYGKATAANNSVLFLVKCARLRKLLVLRCAHLLINSKTENVALKFNANMLGEKLDDTLPLAKEISKPSQHVSYAHQQSLHLLRLFTKPLFSTTLVGCDSLESMQRCIIENNASVAKGASILDSPCLGGIYNDIYIDKIDCFRLAQLNAQSVHLELTIKLNRGAELLLEQLLWPKLNLNLCLDIKADNHKRLA